ncbi:MAG: putative rane protein [Frankiaceae bacterium]|nr:putative rane protein [Frankiaceae bacterium]
MSEAGADRPRREAGAESQQPSAGEVVPREAQGGFDDLLAQLPPNVDKATVEFILAALHISSSEPSPWPDPEMLAQYDSVLGEGAAREIIDIIRDEQRHRHELELAPARITRLGTVLQFLLALALIAAGFVAIVTGATAVGVAIFGTGIVAVGVLGVTRQLRATSSDTVSTDEDD